MYILKTKTNIKRKNKGQVKKIYLSHLKFSKNDYLKFIKLKISDIMSRIVHFLEKLKESPSSTSVFNPWWQNDPKNDASPKSPEHRRNNLNAYLTDRLLSADILLLGEAMGYQGGHFSGIAMTSERILLGKHSKKELNKSLVCESIKYPRTSNPEININGFNEPTATVVWQAILQSGFDPRKIVIWNAFPWHPYVKGNILSNRTPGQDEMERGVEILRDLLDLFNFKTVVGVGKKSEKLLLEAQINNIAVRHPANGGATLFRKQFEQIMLTQELP